MHLKESSVKNNLVFILVIFISGFLVHSAVINNPFKTLDDKASILSNPEIKSLSNVKEIFTSSFFGGNSYYRPLVSLSFMLNYHFAKEDPRPYNLTNLIIHLLTSVLLFLLLKSFLFSWNLSFFTALLFAVHPVHWEAVSNIPGRAILLSAFFSLGAFYFFVLSEGPRRKWLYYFFSLLCFVLSILSKESGCMLPAVLIAYLVFIRRTEETELKKILPVIPFFAVVTAYLVLRKTLGVTQVYFWPSLKMELLGVITFLRSVFTDLRMMVFPYDLHFDRSRLIFTRFLSVGLLTTVFSFIAILSLLVMNRKRISLRVWFLICWFFIELFPVSQLIGTIGVTAGYISTAEHFLYVPSISFFALLILLGNKVFEINKEKRAVSPSLLKVVFAAFFVVMSIITVEQEIYSSQEFSMLERTLKYDPGNNRIRSSLALGYAEKGLYARAEVHFRGILRSDPANVRARIGLGKALCDQGRYLEGIGEYEKVHNAGPLEGLLKENLKLSYDIVIKDYRDRIEKEKDDPELYNSLGFLYARTGELSKAVILYKKAIALDPYHKEALFNLASAYESMKDWGKAEEYYSRLLRLKGDIGQLRIIANKRLEEINNLTGK